MVLKCKQKNVKGPLKITETVYFLKYNSPYVQTKGF
jgi:hypothetical protein